METTYKNTPVTKILDFKMQEIIDGVIAVRPDLSRTQVGDHIRSERKICRTRTTHFIAVAPVADVVAWILQGIEE